MTKPRQGKSMRGDAQRLVDAAHQECPYFNATRGNADVGLTLA